MYWGLKEIGCKVIWSLSDFELPEENPNFYVKPWLPQIELLSHPAMKVGLAHCGHGAALEFSNLGVPVVAWPHFEDQHDNSEEFVKRKCGVMLANIRISSMDLDVMHSYNATRDKAFTK
jgi:UDP:flavonoid glycosyltransferase YjiC (YdhE family)